MSDKLLDLRKCVFKGADLSGKTLAGALMSETDLTNSNLRVRGSWDALGEGGRCLLGVRVCRAHAALMSRSGLHTLAQPPCKFAPQLGALLTKAPLTPV